jgi:hypothetical protein
MQSITDFATFFLYVGWEYIEFPTTFGFELHVTVDPRQTVVLRFDRDGFYMKTA